MKTSTQDWAKESLDKVIFDAILNIKIVKIGIWKTFIKDMNEQDDENYSFFLATVYKLKKLS